MMSLNFRAKIQDRYIFQIVRCIWWMETRFSLEKHFETWWWWRQIYPNTISKINSWKDYCTVGKNKTENSKRYKSAINNDCSWCHLVVKKKTKSKLQLENLIQLVHLKTMIFRSKLKCQVGLKNNHPFFS